MELLARVRAVLRRTQAHLLHTLPTPLTSGDLIIDFDSQEVSLRGTTLKLTPTEFKLLYHLASNPGETQSQQVLLEKIWGEAYLEDTTFLKVHIHYLRQKLGDSASNPRWIATVPRKGYLFLATQ